MAYFRCNPVGVDEVKNEEYFATRIRELIGDSITLSYNISSTGGSPGNGRISWSINAQGVGFNKLVNLLQSAGYNVSGSGNISYSWDNTAHKDSRSVSVLSAAIK